MAKDVLEALAQIGTGDAIADVLADVSRSPRASAIALEHVDHPAVFWRTCRTVLEMQEARAIAIRAIGIRKDRRYRDQLFAGLYSDPTSRGQAALAIARIFGAVELPRLRRAFDEAGDSYERIFAALAVCVAAPRDYPEVAASLRRDLCDIDDFRPWYRRDILDILRGVGHPKAAALAEALALVSDHATADIDRSRAAIDQLDDDV